VLCLSEIEGKLKGLRDLVASYPYDEFRNCKLFPKKKREELLYHRILDLTKKEQTWTVIEEERDKLIGLLILRRLDWDSKHFGLNMGKIEYILTRGDISYKEDLKLKAKLLSKALEIAKANDIQHLTCKIDCSDYASLFVLEEQGFHLMELLLKYVIMRGEYELPSWKSIYKVREAKSVDLPILMQIARKCFKGSRFHRDPYLSEGKASELFGEWIKNSLCGNMADGVLVAVNAEDKPVGFFTYNFEEDILKYCGVKAWGRGLQACIPGARGAYVGLISEAIRRWEGEGIEVGIFDVVCDRSLIKIYERIGMDLIRLTYVLHKGGVK
jgi:hypothetical protein